MPDVLTFLLIELGAAGPAADTAASGDPAQADVVDRVLAAGGAVVAAPARPPTGSSPTGSSAGRGAVTAAVFQLAGDAARTALDIAAALASPARPAPPPPGPPGPPHPNPTGRAAAGPATPAAQAPVPVGAAPRTFRMVLCTGPAHASGATLGGPALSRATVLLGQAGPHQVLATASTAVMASPTLPRGVELLDLGARVLGQGQPPERVYELRTTRSEVDPGRADDAAASNLDWARRAAHGSVLGRDRPLATLESAWKATLGGDRRMVLLMGDGGIGKTTVAAELALRVHAEGALVLYGRWDQGSLAPYQAVREALGSYASRCPPARLRRDLEGRSDEIARLLPDVGARVGGVRPPLLGDPDGERLRLFEAIADWLDLLAERHPVLLVLDDLHWAGRSSSLLVDHLRHHHRAAPPGNSPPLMVLLTARTGELPPTGGLSGIETLLDVEGVERIELQGLDETVVVRLVEDAIGRPLGPDDGDVVRWLTDDTAGNPLFVQEVLRGVLDNPDRGAALRDARHRLPERLAGIVDWRLSQLPPQTTAVLADAALIGPTFELELLADATGTAPVTLRRPLDVAVQAGLLRALPPGDYGFAHEVVRRTLHDQLDGDRAAVLHRRIAGALTSRALDGEEVSAVEVADHHLRGADATTARQAVRWARQAAEAARRETAFESAVHLLTRAVDVHDRFADGDWFRGPIRGPGAERERPGPGADASHDSHAALACELRLELAEAHDRAGEFSARDERHLEAAALARQLGGAEAFTRAALGLRGRLPAAPPPDPAARDLLEEALARLPDGDSRGRALLLARLAHVRHFDAGYEERRALSDEAVAMARRLDAPVVLAEVLVARGLALSTPGDTEEELACGEEIVQIGERTGDPDLILQGLRVQISALLVLGRHGEARDQAARFAALAQQVRHPDHLRIATMWEIVWANIEGRHREAAVLVDDLRRQLLALGHSQSTLLPFAQRIVPQWLRGELDDSRRLLEVLRAANPDFVVGWAWAQWFDASAGREEQARVELDQRDPAEFVATVRQDYMWWPTMIGCTIAATASHSPEWAAVLSETLAPFAGRHCVIGYSAYAGAVDHHLGTLALVVGRHDEAVELLDRGLDQHRQFGATAFVALSDRWLARALAQRNGPGDRERAAAVHQESVDLGTQLELHGLPVFDDAPSGLL